MVLERMLLRDFRFAGLALKYRCGMACRRNGKFTGFPVLGVQWQQMESTALRRAYGLTGGRKGVLVRFIGPTFQSAAVLRPGDIIMRFDGVPVASDGTVPFR
jgi:hypothetical protein